MALHTIAEAARMVGKDRSTLYRHMEKGRLSKVEGADGSPAIDTAELMRVYGALQAPQSQDGVAPVAEQHSATPLHDAEKRARREARAALEAARRREVELLEAQVVDLRERVAAVEAERDTWRDTYQAEAASHRDTRAEVRQLTDQREAEVVAEPLRRNWWSRWRGRPAG